MITEPAGYFSRRTVFCKSISGGSGKKTDKNPIRYCKNAKTLV